MYLIFFLLCFVLQLQAKEMKVTTVDCGKPTYAGHVVSSEYHPQPITGVEIEASSLVNLTAPITSGTFHLSIKAPFTTLHKSHALCGSGTWDIGLPLGLGKLSWTLLPCPLQPGSLVLHQKFYTSSLAPSSTSTSQLVVADEKNRPFLCMEITTVIG
eukprot:NODE_5791_length_610_cov_64.190476_g5627_i0.p1 GENE.NODE_5791_length_610_cov_64.190476_g5627_i0~~NODE_5791_length_610_cov_64.190476_g5627_i0.p1  ORF type:complete len:174 (+),score=35.40 NODE_5791_length_610_cov_64.190476_g5627_i0:54-524(+)